MRNLIKTLKEAGQEFEGNSKVSKNEAEKFFKKNFLHLPNNPQLLLN